VLEFFFSSRRRHTRFSRDWSSDVCSSDLDVSGVQAERGRGIRGELGGESVWAGTRRMAASQGAEIGAEVERRLLAVEERGETPRSEERRVGKERRPRGL